MFRFSHWLYFNKGPLTGAIIFAVISLVCFCGVTLAETINRVVAIVNKEVVTLHELNKKIEELTGLNPEDVKTKDESRFHETRSMILELLINEKLTQEKILEMGISVSPKEIDAAVENVKSDNHWTQEDLLARLKNERIPYEKYRDNIKKEIERFKLISFVVKSKIIITDELVRQYYENHKSELGSEEEVHLGSIFLSSKNPEEPKNKASDLYRKGEDILKRLRQGEDFGKLAREFSQGPASEAGGDLGRFQTAQLEPNLKKIISDLPEGGISDLVIRPDGIQIVRVIQKLGGKTKSFEEAKSAVYNLLYKEEINKRYNSWIQDLRQKSYIKIVF
ncbi:MAG: peptidylprolyl isomerase [Pseudomonadota bacterium]